MRPRSLSLFLFLLPSISGCEKGYVGDGVFIDRGRDSAGRYEIDFGEVAGNTEHKFSIYKVPEGWLTFGLRTRKPMSSIAAGDLTVTIRVRRDGKWSIDRTEPLSRWTRTSNLVDSMSFFYIKGEGGTRTQLYSQCGCDVFVKISGANNRVDGFELVAMSDGWK